MKKFIALLLSILILGSFPAYAENTNPSQNNKPKIITCNENSTDEMCKAIEITKTEIPLESYLKKSDSGCLYSITNINPNSIELIQIYDYDNAQKEIDSVKFERNPRTFPYTLLRPILGTIVLPFAPLMYGMSNHPNTTFAKVFADGLWFFYFGAVIDTIATPYYLIANPINDKKAIKESKKFNNKFESITLKHNDKTQFCILLPKREPKNAYLERVSIKFKVSETNQEYLITY